MEIVHNIKYFNVKKGQVKIMTNEKDLARMVEEVQGMPAGTKTEIFLDTETGKMTSVFCWTTNEFHEKDDDELLVEIFPGEIDYLFKEYGEDNAIKAIEELIVGKIEAAEEEAEWAEEAFRKDR